MTAKASAPKQRFRLSTLLGTWSAPAAQRAVRAAVLIPALVAFTFKGLSAEQVTLFATFGGFAHLVMANFSGDRRRQLFDHLALGVAGSALLTIGTAVSTSALAASLVALAVTFVVLEAGSLSPNIAAGGLPSMLLFILPVTSATPISTVPARLGGFWLATGLATAVVVLMTPRQAGSRLRAAAAEAAAAMSREAGALARGLVPAGGVHAETEAAYARLSALFRAGPNRPTALTAADQALGSLVEELGWVARLLADIETPDVHEDFDEVESALVGTAAQVLSSAAARLRGEDERIDLNKLEEQRRGCPATIKGSSSSQQATVLAHSLYHARALAITVRTFGASAMVATGQASRAEVVALRRSWADGSETSRTTAGPAYWRAALNLRSVWARNSARAAVAVAGAVAVATLTDVERGFWVAVGTLSVLRTTAVGTAGTAFRALLGTTLGVVVAGAVVVGIGTNTDVLWALLPVVSLLAAYAPGVSPFAVGQAAFSIYMVIVFNLLVPVGWKVGEVRVEDVAIGCGISLAAGFLVWPRGVLSTVTTDLDEALVYSARLFLEAAGWAVGLRDQPPSSERPALDAAVRLDDALRAYLAEPGQKPVSADDLWSAAGAVRRLRLTGVSLADMPGETTGSKGAQVLGEIAAQIATWYETVGSHMRYGQPSMITPLHVSWPADPKQEDLGSLAYVEQHLRHLEIETTNLAFTATRLRHALRQPWWQPNQSGADRVEQLHFPSPSPEPAGAGS